MQQALEAQEKAIFGNARLEWTDSSVSEREDHMIAPGCLAKPAMQSGVAVGEAA